LAVNVNDAYLHSRSLDNWKKFRGTVKKMKQKFFNEKMNEITNKRCGPWKLMNWVKKRKLSTIKAIQYNRYLYI